MNRRTLSGLFPGVAAIAALLICMVPALATDAKSANGVIEVASVWARADGPTERTIYLEIINHGTTDDRLVGLSTPLAEKCILEKASWKGLNMTTVALAEIPIPAMTRTQLKPGGTYIRALEVKSPDDNKSSLPLTLNFAKAGQVDVTAELSVRKLGPTR